MPSPERDAPRAEIVVRGGLGRTLPLAAVDRAWLLADFVRQYRAWLGQ